MLLVGWTQAFAGALIVCGLIAVVASLAQWTGSRVRRSLQP
jgi:hypothetical protein